MTTTPQAPVHDPTAPVRVTLLQLACPDDEDHDSRVARVLDQLRALDRRETDLVVLPELWATGYFNFDRYEEQAQPLDGPMIGALREVAAERGLHLVAGSFVERTPDGALCNTTALLGPDGAVLGTYRKIHLFGYESAEAKLLTAGDEVRVVPTGLGTTGLGAVGLATCYDLRFPELFRLLVDGGAQLVVVVSAWPLARLEHWELLVRARAVENQVFLVACNVAGSQAGTAMAGTSIVVGPWGEVLTRGGTEPAVLRAALDPARLSAVRAEFPVLTHRRLGTVPEREADSIDRTSRGGLPPGP
ncbi:carbon-nitrogen family hydrolase [Parafrankia elaeagni]|uniref:carbon-nitrogen family hydrolase n=1 Tax=Parafrankia elaeagni TaxID=222534 RepID=UPI0003821A37|nr:carbon-nitrogen family hydrolase [Parafrankia elaeagni]